MSIKLSSFSTPSRQVWRDSQDRHWGMTIVELLVVVTVISILLVFAVIKIPSMRLDAMATQCRSNLKNLLIASLSYASEKEGELPIPANWDEPGDTRYWWIMLKPYMYPELPANLRMGPDYRSPASPMYAEWGDRFHGGNWFATSYMQATSVKTKKRVSLFQVSDPSRTAYLIPAVNSGNLKIDSEENFNSLVINENVASWYNGGINVIYIDGHTEFIRNPTWERVNPSSKSGMQDL